MKILTLTKVMLFSIGIAALLISAVIFVIDSHSTANVFSSIFAFAFGEVGNSGKLDHVNVDFEVRFYSVFWAAYGGALL
ncbi:MAG: hypothetical protein P8P65_09905 [Planktotalea sp.]|uniref:hypothetical protein n=1 Tax=Planktotalea sp. TaxID=2029877 RepID=UPI0012E9D9C6|nr:hypothetical protein [Planktotalea sp.]MDG1076943.1 hypothetical protein [Planktotalea sp.]MDG1084068.1 hypothetical protein [Planktotalea sp.]